MSNDNLDPLASTESPTQPEDSTFAEMLSDFEQQHADAKHGEDVVGTVVSVNPETILIDIGRKIEGALAASKWQQTEAGEAKRGATVTVNVGPRNDDGYYELSTIRVERPKDWIGLEKALDQELNIAGVVAEQVKGGFRVDIGVRAFM